MFGPASIPHSTRNERVAVVLLTTMKQSMFASCVRETRACAARVNAQCLYTGDTLSAIQQRDYERTAPTARLGGIGDDIVTARWRRQLWFWQSSQRRVKIRQVVITFET